MLSHFSCVLLFAILCIVTHQAPLLRGSPGKNTWVGCRALLQGVFPIQGSNLPLPHCGCILYHWDTAEVHSSCCSHAFWETNSLRRTMQIVKCSLLHWWAQGRVSSAKNPDICENLLYPMCTCLNPWLQIPKEVQNKGRVNTIPIILTFMCYVLKQLNNWPIINKPDVTL